MASRSVEVVGGGQRCSLLHKPPPVAPRRVCVARPFCRAIGYSRLVVAHYFRFETRTSSWFDPMGSAQCTLDPAQASRARVPRSACLPPVRGLANHRHVSSYY